MQVKLRTRFRMIHVKTNIVSCTSDRTLFALIAVKSSCLRQLGHYKSIKQSSGARRRTLHTRQHSSVALHTCAISSFLPFSCCTQTDGRCWMLRIIYSMFASVMGKRHCARIRMCAGTLNIHGLCVWILFCLVWWPITPPPHGVQNLQPPTLTSLQLMCNMWNIYFTLKRKNSWSCRIIIIVFFIQRR